MIKAELTKASRRKRFWVLLIVFAVLIPLVQLLAAAIATGRISSNLAENSTVTRAISEIASPYSMARNYVGGVLQFLNIMLYILAAIVGGFLISEDRTYKMWKTILVAQPNRLSVLTAKFISGMLILLFIIIGGLLGALLFGSISIVFGYATTFAGDWGNLLTLTALQWLVLAAPLALGFLISWLTISPAIAVVSIIFTPIILEAIIEAIIRLTGNRISLLNAALEVQRMQENVDRVKHFFFTPNVGIGSRLMGNLLQNVGVGNAPTTDWNQIWASVGISAVYFGLFAAVLIWNFTTRDVHD
jgi:ABC-type transport system involved in multi-copper enzyme maturation permease subunit